MSRAERLALIDRHDPALPVTRQCGLMTVSRSSVYRPPAPASDEDLAIMALIDRQYLARPYYGSPPPPPPPPPPGRPHLPRHTAADRGPRPGPRRPPPPAEPHP